MEKPTFNNIWKFLKRIDAFAGVFLFKDPSEKKTLLEKYLSYTMKKQAILITVFFISTLYVTNFKLISIVFCASVLTFMASWYISMTTMIYRKKTFLHLIKWCEELYDIERKYHPKIQDIAVKNVVAMEKFCMKLLISLALILYIENVGYSLGFGIICIFLPENLHKKYDPPIPFYLPFKRQDTWLAFGITVFAELMICIDGATFTLYVAGPFFCIWLHIFGYLKTIVDAAQQMKGEMLSKVRFFVVDENIRGKEGELSFEEWIKILTDMISDVSSIFTLATNFYSITCVLVEFASLGAFFMCGLTVIIIHDQYFFGIGITFVTALLYVICHINESILDKFEEIHEIFYDTPWYGFNQKQRKILLIALNCNKIHQQGITAAKIHSLTIERFGVVVKMGYTNLLVLKDLIQK